MGNWIGKFSLLMRRLRDVCMDTLPLSTTSEERRQNQYLPRRMLKDRDEVLKFWIRTHQGPGQVVRHTGEQQ